MPEPIILPGTGLDRCRCLRSKEMYVPVEPDPGVPHLGCGLFWCVHTQNGLGPDGQAAEPASCQSGRSCFEAL